MWLSHVQLYKQNPIVPGQQAYANTQRLSFRVCNQYHLLIPVIIDFIPCGHDDSQQNIQQDDTSECDAWYVPQWHAQARRCKGWSVQAWDNAHLSVCQDTPDTVQTLNISSTGIPWWCRGPGQECDEKHVKNLHDVVKGVLRDYFVNAIVIVHGEHPLRVRCACRWGLGYESFKREFDRDILEQRKHEYDVATTWTTVYAESNSVDHSGRDLPHCNRKAASNQQVVRVPGWAHAHCLSKARDRHRHRAQTLACPKIAANRITILRRRHSVGCNDQQNWRYTEIELRYASLH